MVEQTTPSLPVWQTVSAAYRSFLIAPADLARALSIPLLLAIGLGMSEVLFASDDSSSFGAATFVLVISYAVLGLAWGRFALLGERPPLMPEVTKLRRFFVFSGYLLLFGIIYLVIIFLTVAVLAVSTPNFVAIGLIVVVLCLIASWPLARFSLALPATAIDRGLGLGGAWRLGRGNAARLLAALFLVNVPVLAGLTAFFSTVVYMISIEMFPLESNLEQPASILAWFAFTLFANGLQLIGFALVMEVLARAYQHLKGWQPNRQEILERFE